MLYNIITTIDNYVIVTIKMYQYSELNWNIEYEYNKI